MISPSNTHYVVGKRYINTKNRQPLTLLYIGPLPPNTSNNEGGPSSDPIWLGVEYDDPSHGKGHSGTYRGTQMFKTKQEGAGAFIRLRKGDELDEGKTFVQALKERYGYTYGSQSAEEQKGEVVESVILGSSSGIVVEAPGMEGVAKRLRNLEKLRQIGLEDEYICGVGGTEEERLELKERLRGLKVLNISRNLMTSWSQTGEILDIVSGLQTLIINDSRFSTTAGLGIQSGIRELHIARSLIAWSGVDVIIDKFDKLEELHLTGNTALSEMPIYTESKIRCDTLRILNLEGCDIITWDVIEKATKRFPNLEILHLSSNPLAGESLPVQENKTSSCDNLKTLVLLSTPLSSYTSLANLSSRLPHLEHLRFSLTPSQVNTVEQRLGGNDEEDRGVLITLFPKLIRLNGSDVGTKEREEAERRFCRTFNSSGSAPLVHLYDGLMKKHDLQISVPILQPSSLRSKLITLHIYPSTTEAFTLSILPSAAIALLKRKIAKKLGWSVDGCRLFTVKRVQVEGGVDEEVWRREKVAEVEEGECGYWFEDGDGVIVETA